jgi:hypothetical protein
MALDIGLDSGRVANALAYRCSVGQSFRIIVSTLSPTLHAASRRPTSNASVIVLATA